MTPRASVVVATFHRPGQLDACLRGIRAQTRAADEVVVVVHAADPLSLELVGSLQPDWPELRVARVVPLGTVAAYNAGLAQATGDYVCYVDDDAVASPDWLARIVDTFGQDDRIAGVGGRDIVIEDGRVEVAEHRFAWLLGEPSVGQIQWVGRMTANHHIATGAARDVDVLKGVNMSFRSAALGEDGFDVRLRGIGAQVHSELSVCLPLRRRGWRLVYDPAIVVNHYPARRPAGDERGLAAPEATLAAAHNEALAILEYLPPIRRAVFALYGLLIGNTESPGLAVTIRSLLLRRPAPLSRLMAAQRGRAAAWMTRRTPRTPLPVQIERLLTTTVP